MRKDVIKLKGQIAKLEEQIEHLKTRIQKIQSKCKHENYEKFPCPAGGSSDYHCLDCDKWL